MEDLTNVEWVNARQRFAPPKRFEPPIDNLVSHLVGFKVYARDPRLMKLVLKWKANKPIDSMEPDNFLYDAAKIKELKEVLSRPLC